MLTATAAEVAAVLDSPGESAGVRCAAMEALFWLQARPTLFLRQGVFWCLLAGLSLPMCMLSSS